MAQTSSPNIVSKEKPLFSKIGCFSVSTPVHAQPFEAMINDCLFLLWKKYDGIVCRFEIDCDSKVLNLVVTSTPPDPSTFCDFIGKLLYFESEVREYPIIFNIPIWFESIQLLPEHESLFGIKVKMNRNKEKVRILK